MKTRTLLLFALLIVAFAAFAALSPEKAAWAKGPVQYLLTPDEITRWNSLQTDAEADQFIALFWARRDPTPGTPRNEFREDFDARVAYADQNFGTSRTRGALSDRGKILILFGAPTRVGRVAPTMASPTTSTQPFNTDEDQNATVTTWAYEGEMGKKLFGIARGDVQFSDRVTRGEVRLERGQSVDLAAAQRRAVAAAITQPNLTQVPTPQPQAAAAPAVAAATTASASLKTPALETAITDARAGKIASKGASVMYTEFLSPTGEPFVPVGLFVPASAGLTADAADTFFGVIEDSTGKRVEVFEAPAKGTLSRNSLLFDHTANLPSGNYTATLGLAKAGAPVLVATSPLKVSVSSKEAKGTSRLILADLIETIEAAPVKAPFAFGKLKIVPRSTFTNKDDLGYVIEIHNPGLPESAPTTSTTGTAPSAATMVLPKLQFKMDLMDEKGKTLAGAPLMDAQALPLSAAAGPGEYVIADVIPLSKMNKPLPNGDYTLRMKIVDTVTKQSYTVEQKFRIAS